MGEIKNNYLSIANNDYLYVTKHRDPEFRNNSVALCEQVIEKLFKSIIEKVVVDNESLLRGHNLKRLYDSISSEISLDKEARLYLLAITDFYFDARYPGDDFVNVSKEDEVECFRVMEEVYKIVNEWHSRNSNSVLDSVIVEASGR